ncbi:MAG: 3-deoxy-D-manno-octulosonic acid transferase [Bacteroidetes bacterium]|nr:MAG: 3-deoxy-D-manno-octulosonic acid transferase [Bacteroidota bacterium]
MKILYDIAIRCYGFGIWLAAFFNPKAQKWISGRKNWRAQLKSFEFKNPVWFHCASLGEFEQARPLIEKIKRETNLQVVITFFSPSGYEIRKNYPHADMVMYLPLDTVENARFFVQTVSPAKAFFVKYEFWVHFFEELKKNNIPLYLISAVFRKDQVFFKWYGGLFRQLLQIPEKIYCQDEESVRLLSSIQVKAICAGDTRFDTVLDNYKNSKPIPEIEKFSKDCRVIILGSSWQPEEDIAAKSWEKLKQKHAALKLIIAPHDVSETHIREIENKFKGFCGRYSRNQFDKDVLIIDCIGLLSAVYRYTHLAFIGGGFANQLHNILEAAVFGNVILFGDNYDKFWEAKALIKEGGAFSVCDENDFFNITDNLLENTILFEELSTQNRLFVKHRTGAVDMIYKEVFSE